MDSIEMGVLLGGISLIAFTLWFFFGKREDESTPVTSSADADAYDCPMHPWITSNDPSANCSICGMKLMQKN